MMKNTLLLLSLFFLFASQNVFAQEVHTEFRNPSFEGTPRPQHPPEAWWNCGNSDETPVDTHPCDPPVFGVSRPAHDRETYIGMVVRENGSNESVSQILANPLKANQCYSFSVYLSVSETYISSLRDRLGEINFSTPIFLRIWGGTNLCNKKELLAVSDMVNHKDWRKHNFQISPKSDLTFILIETYYHDEFNAPNGHILLDNLSPVYTLDCETIDKSLSITNPILTPQEFLEKTIIREGQKISFNRKNKLSKPSTKAIDNLIDAILAVEEIELVFCIRTRKKEGTTERINELNAKLEEMGFDKKRYTIRKYDRSGLDKDNYWFSENEDLLIGLSDTKK